METNDFLYTEFSFIDEFGNKTKVETSTLSEVVPNTISHLELVVEKFNAFLIACGFNSQVIINEENIE